MKALRFLGLALLASVAAAFLLAAAWIAAAPSGDDPEIAYRIDVPPGGKPGTRHPAVMVFGGFETAAAALDLIHPPEPTVLASFDYPYAGPGRIRFPEILREAPKLKRAIHRTIAEIPRLHRRLREHPAVLPGRVTLLGASFGAPLAVQAAARDPELRRLILIHGFGRVQETIRARTALALRERSGWAPRPADLAGAFVGWAAWTYLELPEVEAAAAALGKAAGTAEARGRHRTLLIEAVDDELIPAAARDSLRRALADSGTELDYRPWPGRHLGPGAHDLIRELTDAALAWLARE